MKTKRVAISLTKPQYDAIMAESNRTGATMNSLVRRCINARYGISEGVGINIYGHAKDGLADFPEHIEGVQECQQQEAVAANA